MIEGLARLLEEGNTVKFACAEMNISRQTYYSWMRQGERSPHSTHGRFRLEMEGALAKAENKLVQTVRNGVNVKGLPDWKAAAHLLAVRNPEEFGKRVIKEHVVRQGVQETLERIQARISPEAWAEVIGALADLHGVAAEPTGRDEGHPVH